LRVLERQSKGFLSFGIRAQLRAMVIETRGGAQIGVLEGNMQRLQLLPTPPLLPIIQITPLFLLEILSRRLDTLVDRIQ
jgi:hypothetical protein